MAIPINFAKQTADRARKTSGKRVYTQTSNCFYICVRFTQRAAAALIVDELKEEMWDRADELLKTPGSIVQAPGYDALMVQHAVGTHSQTPHPIKSTKSGKFVCDCNPYKSFKICEHTLAASESLGKLRLFLDWKKKDKTTVNITNLVMSDISSGKKPPVSKPRKGGRTPLGKEKPLLEVTRNPIAEDTSTMETLEALGDMEKDDPFEVIYLHQTNKMLWVRK